MTLMDYRTDYFTNAKDEVMLGYPRHCYDWKPPVDSLHPCASTL